MSRDISLNLSRIVTVTAFGLTILLSAFLLFQIQPLIARFILPWFGGTPAVWTACMLFFQCALLAGYAFAHFSVRRLSGRLQAIVQVGLVLLAVAFLPIIPDPAWRIDPQATPTGPIFLLLAAVVGAPYFVLATTGPLLQAWYARLHPGKSPYRLYSLSNLGSLLALVSYPFVVEPTWVLAEQARGWSRGFLAYALLVAICAWQVVRHGRTPSGSPQREQAPEPAPVLAGSTVSSGDRLLWLLLAATASALFLATTNQICQDIAVVPFLWVLPLALYLLSFIATFSSDGFYDRGLFLPAAALSVVWVCWALFRGSDSAITTVVLSYSVSLFLCCMVCHGELARQKPAPRDLTGFYLWVSAGGALGGVFVALISPLIFADYLEFHVALFGAGLLVLAVLWREGKQVPARQVAAFVAALGLLLTWEAVRSARYYETAERNFYGVLRTRTIYDEEYGDRRRSMYHGGINHGFQFLSSQNTRLAVGYFGPHTGIGMAKRLYPRSQNRRIGVAGLGVGAVAVLTERGDELRFYEINPAVDRLARERFRYLEECPANWDVVLGDARRTLEGELATDGSRGYDLLVLDAFTGNAIPVHLLTYEAFTLYASHLREDGILVLNITNRHLDLEPVVRAAADRLGMAAVLVETEIEPDKGYYGASWMVLTRNEEWLEAAEVKELVREQEEVEGQSRILWTDDYVNLLGALYRSPTG